MKQFLFLNNHQKFQMFFKWRDNKSLRINVLISFIYKNWDHKLYDFRCTLLTRRTTNTFTLNNPNLKFDVVTLTSNDSALRFLSEPCYWGTVQSAAGTCSTRAGLHAVSPKWGQRGVTTGQFTPLTQIPHKEETPAALPGSAPWTGEVTVNYYLSLSL